MLIIEIYGQSRCSFCERAKKLCEELDLTYAYYDISEDEFLKENFLERTNGARTVPQIFVAGKLIGGFTEFKKAVDDGIIQEMIGGQ